VWAQVPARASDLALVRGPGLALAVAPVPVWARVWARVPVRVSVRGPGLALAQVLAAGSVQVSAQSSCR
jgi:hypothetical protein